MEINIELDGIKEFVEHLDNLQFEMEKIIVEEMTDISMLAEEGAKALAPKDVGDLADSITFDGAVNEGGLITVRGGSNLSYALERHEAPYGSGTYSKYDMGRLIPDYYVDGRGLRTRRSNGWRGYPAGRKYLENMMKAIEPDWQRAEERMLQRILDLV